MRNSLAQFTSKASQYIFFNHIIFATGNLVWIAEALEEKFT
uniref:Uncharacterized protein n=1 Tax=Setaria italica TaxID=4555 RepID=K3YNQ2_SETIT